MKRWFGSLAAVILLLGFCASAGAAQLQGAMLLDTGYFTCGDWAPAGWTNPGPAITIKSTAFWVSGGPDFTVALQREAMPFHYATPQTKNYTQDYGPDGLIVLPGESLYLFAYCPGTNRARAGVLAIYTVE